ncbi:hypothetical protein H4R34_001451 [Dimargaris verticillata]|uniref:Pentacotripeptide-repeat region of PRORP domain-containing protein n=1 Tax=Dimargaris verticillata TaxID=2761393 RepID=A0A9W8BBD4_9FUNG|nr:hypothetical protein H4R34_001451 [Dimargaris verticillata]
MSSMAARPESTHGWWCPVRTLTLSPACLANKGRAPTVHDRIPNHGYEPPIDTKRHQTIPFTPASSDNAEPAKPLGFLSGFQPSSTPATQPKREPRPPSRGPSSRAVQAQRSSPAEPQIPSVYFSPREAPISAKQYRLVTQVFTNPEALWQYYQRLKGQGKHDQLMPDVYRQTLQTIMDAGRPLKHDRTLSQQTKLPEPGVTRELKPAQFNRQIQMERLKTGEYHLEPQDPAVKQFKWRFTGQWERRIAQLCWDWVAMVATKLSVRTTTDGPSSLATIFPELMETPLPQPTQMLPGDSPMTVLPTTTSAQLLTGVFCIQDFKLIIQALVAVQRADLAQRALSLLAQCGIHPATPILDPLFLHYYSQRDPKGMRSLLQQMYRWNLAPSQFQYSTLIALHAQDPAQLPRAIAYYEEMKTHGWWPNQYAYCPIIMGLAHQRDREGVKLWCRRLLQSETSMSIQAYNIVLWSLGRTQQLEVMWKVYFRMRHQVIADTPQLTVRPHAEADEWQSPAPDSATYTIMLDAFMRAKDVVRVAVLQRDWQASRVGWSAHICNTWIKYWCENGQLENANKMLQLMPARGISPTEVNYLTIITQLCRRGRHEDAHHYLTQMQAQGLSPTLPIFTRLIRSYAEAKNLAMVDQLLDQMRCLGISGNAMTQNAVLVGLMHCYRYHEAIRWFNTWNATASRSGAQDCPAPNWETYCLMATMYLRMRKVPLALVLVDEQRARLPDAQHGIWVRLAQACARHHLPKALNLLYDAWVARLPKDFSHSPCTSGPETSSTDLTNRCGPRIPPLGGKEPPNPYSGVCQAFMHAFSFLWRKPDFQRVWTDMERWQLPVDAAGLTILFRACGRLGLPVELKQTQKLAQRQGLALNLANFHALLSSHGFLNQPQAMVHTITGDMHLQQPSPVVPTRTTLEIALSFPCMWRAKVPTSPTLSGSYRVIHGHIATHYPDLVPVLEQVAKEKMLSVAQLRTKQNRHRDQDNGNSVNDSAH